MNIVYYVHEMVVGNHVKQDIKYELNVILLSNVKSVC